MLMKLTKFCRREEGATIIEFAFVFPIFILLVFGILEFGLIFATTAILENSTVAVAREQRALAGIVTAANANLIENRIVAKSSNFLRKNRLVVQLVPIGVWGGATNGSANNSRVGASNGGGKNSSGNAGAVGAVIQYRINYSYYFIVPLMGRLLSPLTNVWPRTAGGNGIVLQVSTVVQNEPSI